MWNEKLKISEIIGKCKINLIKVQYYEFLICIWFNFKYYVN